MKKKQVRITRRQVLRGASGFALGLPFLPSLVPGRAWAQETSFDPGKRFVAIMSFHGGVLEKDMFPEQSQLSHSETLYPGMDIRRGTLSRTVSGSNASLSTVLTAPADRLTDGLVGKMNVLFGLDIPFYIAHHTGGHLGNYARNDGNGADGQALNQRHMPTIDQLMAWSPSFYPDLSNITTRSIISGSFSRFSWNWSNPSTRGGNIQEVPAEYDLRAMFRRAFVPDEAMDTEEQAAARPPVVDRVLDAYRSLRQSNRRMSADDRQRLDDHMDRLSELQRRLNTAPVRLATCEGFSTPTVDNSQFEQFHEQLNETIAAAFLCGTSRIAVVGVWESTYNRYPGDWHQEVAHQWYTPGPQQRLVQVNQQVFERIFTDLAYRLDVEESPGQTVLDSSLLSWSQESGVVTHDARALPVITAGSAGGFLNTGLYCDYRNRRPSSILGASSLVDTDNGYYTGLLYNQWLATVLQAMGLPRSEWQDVPHNGSTGYGYPQVSPEYSQTHVSGVVDNASDILPFLRA